MGPQEASGDPSVTPRWTIGFLSLGLTGYYFGSVLGGVADAARRSSCQVVAIQTNDSGQGVKLTVADPLRMPAAWDHLDAFVIVVNALPDAHLQALHATGKPLVLIAQDPPGFSCPVVVPDNVHGIAAVVDHLVEHGHRRIAFVDRRPDSSDDRIRLEAYRAQMVAHGLPVYLPAVLHWTGDDPSARDVALQLLGEEVRPTAVVVSTDVTAIMLIEALREQGVEVPRDMAVVGFDDIADATTCRPPLSTVAQSFPISGSLAVDLVVRALEGEQVEPGYHHTPVSLVKRESCGCPGVRPDTTAATAGTLAERFAADLVAAVFEGGPTIQRPFDRLGSGIVDPSGLVQRRLEQLATVAGEIVELFDTVAETPNADVTAALDAIGTTIHRLVPQDRTVLRIADLIRRYSRSLGQRSGHPDPDLGARLDELSFRLSIQAIEKNMSSRPAEFTYFHQQREHYEYSIGLLRRGNRQSRSLAWLSQAQVRAACLALWGGGDLEGADRERLVVTDSHDATRGVMAEVMGQVCDHASFPPAPLLAAMVRWPGDLLYVLPVRFEGSDWGMLALVGPLELREQARLEMVNYWAVMLCVVLDQDRAVSSLVSEREHLAEAYDRARVLQEEVRVSEERYALAADATNDGLWDWNVEAGTAYFSPRWKSLLGYSEGAIGTAPQEWLDRIHPDDRGAVDRALARHAAGRITTMELECRVRSADDGYRWMLTRARCVHSPDGHLVRLVGSMTDIDDRKRLEEQLRHDAVHDRLTGLPNRTLFLEHLHRAIELAKRRPDYGFAVVFIDLNGFKDINDNLGHEAGDRLLVHVAGQLTAQVRPQDAICRFGGDEFVVLLTNLSVMADVTAMVDRLLAAAATPVRLADRTIAVSASAGVALSPTLRDAGAGGGIGAEEFIRDADAAMYRAKAAKAGGGTVVLFDESMRSEARNQLRRVPN